ncbi:iron complex transport system substrate-binding protein [Rhodoblastus acidophilus]|uniref:Iron complex transport system substrate-binding protein n=1 Tax=Rhodoblastus acidophilus TaxID=1074 RepID=A0A212SDD6_RHOAC|nr:ABC transporter substrate-binding protein [Rhodoblastus acidophilus]PPQ35247.1 ABC transporter substrate-binding protein [Rhodoblastus acidophilus]RAI16570.1 ABC transporter substrate-binding protein [Rhodoblastus acidophilus]SNB83519.1 iron complex transport system substrate-binding protein [Rhodoblastus acidophilus]
MKVFLRIAAVLLALAAPAQAREITDMAGHRIQVPEKITKVFSASYPLTLLMAVIAPDALAAVNTPLTEKQKSFLAPRLAELAAVGGTPGQNRPANPEEIIALHPDVIVAWTDPMGGHPPAEKSWAQTGLPVIYIKVDKIDDYPAALDLIGDLLDRRARTDELKAYVVAALDRVNKAVASVPPEQRVKLLYAESPDGLATECDSSFHMEAFRFAGGDSIYHCAQATHMGMEKISLEEIIARQPALIVALDPKFKEVAAQTPEWRNVKAAAEGRVYAVPKLPFNWLDRPPSFMRVLGVQWLANILYPQALPLDVKAETKKFCKLFFGVELADQDVARLFE